MRKLLAALLFVFTINCFAQNFWERTNGPYAPGYVTAITSSNNGKLYVAIDDAGLYYSSDKGKSFIYLHTALSNTTIPSILIDKHNNIYLGNTNYKSNWNILRSTDNGNTWAHLSPKYVTAIISDSTGNLYACSPLSKWIYRSKDYGSSWTQLSINATITSVKALGINYNGDLFVSGEAGYTSWGTLRSTDNGQSWDSLSVPSNGYITKFVFAPNGKIVALFSSSKYNDTTGFLISNDNGKTWFPRIIPNSSPGGYFDVIYDSTSGSFYAAMYNSLNPVGADFLRSSDNGNTWNIISNISGLPIVMCLYIQNGDIYAGGENGLMRSTDSGVNWVPSDSGFFAVSSSNLTLLPGSKIFANSTNGVFRLADDKMSWLKDDSALTGSFLVSDSGNYFISNNGIYESKDKGSTWKMAYHQDGIYAPTTELTKLSNGYILCGGGWTDGEEYGFSLIWLSKDDGKTWDGVWGHMNNDHIYTMTTTTNDVILAGGGVNNIIRSTDLGNTWSLSINGLPDNISCNVLRAKPNGMVFLGSALYGMFRSLDQGLSWTAINNGLNFLKVSSIAFNKEGAIFVGTSGGGVFVSTDNGDHWATLNSGLWDYTVSSILCDSLGYLYVATKNLGVYRNIGVTSAVEKVKGTIPRIYSLNQNYPNPFNPSTTISYTLPNANHVTIKVYDLLGREVAVLVNDEKNAGNYKVEFNANRLASGIYLYRMQAGNFTKTNKLILLK